MNDEAVVKRTILVQERRTIIATDGVVKTLTSQVELCLHELGDLIAKDHDDHIAAEKIASDKAKIDHKANEDKAAIDKTAKDQADKLDAAKEKADKDKANKDKLEADKAKLKTY